VRKIAQAPNHKFVATTVVEVPTTKLVNVTSHGDYQRHKYIHATSHYVNILLAELHIQDGPKVDTQYTGNYCLPTVHPLLAHPVSLRQVCHCDD
jgi:hypothetical protein